MRKSYRNGILVSAMATAALMAGSQVFAHPNVPLLDKDGIAVSQTTAYSPKTTCGACHNEAVDESTNNPAETTGSRGSYDGGGATKEVVKTQGVMNETTGDAEWVTYTVTDYKHGFTVGRHSQQGRNEAYGNHLRHAVGGKFWESSPGMFGKY